MSEFPLVDADPADPNSEAAETVVRHASIAPQPVPAVEAARWLARWGEQDSQATSDVTVHAAQAVALVCCEVRVGRAELNDLVEYASSQPQIRRLYLFSDVRFGSRVASMAEEAGVALFWWDEAGELQPVGVLAHQRSGTVPARATGVEPTPRPAGGARRRNVPVDTPAAPQATAPQPQAPAPVLGEPVGESAGKRRAAVPTDSPTSRELELDPVLAGVMSPLPEVTLPPGDPLFTPLAQPAAIEPVPEVAAAPVVAEPVVAQAASVSLPVAEAASAESVSVEVDTQPVLPVPATVENPVPVAVVDPAVVEPAVVESAVVESAEADRDPIEAMVEVAPVAGAPVVEPAAAAVADLEPETERSPQDSQIARYLDLLHNRAAAHGVASSRRARVLADEVAATTVPAPIGAASVPAPPRRFADPTRHVAGGPDAAARTAASRPDAPIAGLTPEMIFPQQQSAPAQELMPKPPVAEVAVEPAPVEERGKVRGWFSRRQQARSEGEADEGKNAGSPKAAPSQRSYQMRRTLEARRVMLETGLTPVTDVPEAMEWLRNGDRARAIAVYRKSVGVGLVEAIDALDALGGEY